MRVGRIFFPVLAKAFSATPIFNVSVRYNLIDWDVRARGERFVAIVDACVLDALPPYNALLECKMVACLIRSRNIDDDFAKGVGEDRWHISQGATKPAFLL